VKISVVGTGYVGLVSGVCFAEQGGHSVVCVDVDRAKVDSINRGVPPIHERGLDDLLRKHAGRSLVATLDLESRRHEPGVPLGGRCRRRLHET
jgi:UDP-glucose 6-dehydrogenase